MKIPAIKNVDINVKKIIKAANNKKSTELKSIKNYTQYLNEYGLK